MPASSKTTSSEFKNVPLTANSSTVNSIEQSSIDNRLPECVIMDDVISEKISDANINILSERAEVESKEEEQQSESEESDSTENKQRLLPRETRSIGLKHVALIVGIGIASAIMEIAFYQIFDIVTHTEDESKNTLVADCDYNYKKDVSIMEATAYDDEHKAFQEDYECSTYITLIMLSAVVITLCSLYYKCLQGIDRVVDNVYQRNNNIRHDNIEEDSDSIFENEPPSTSIAILLDKAVQNHAAEEGGSNNVCIDASVQTELVKENDSGHWSDRNSSIGGR